MKYKMLQQETKWLLPKTPFKKMYISKMTVQSIAPMLYQVKEKSFE